MTSLYWFVMILAAREPAAASLVAPRGIAFATALLETEATPDERAILLSIAHHESRWTLSAIGDAGRACGAFQLHAPWRVGVSCDEIAADPHRQIALALHAIRYLKSVCVGPPLRWLGAYAGGTCGAAPLRARELCQPVNLCQ